MKCLGVMRVGKNLFLVPNVYEISVKLDQRIFMYIICKILMRLNIMQKMEPRIIIIYKLHKLLHTQPRNRLFNKNIFSFSIIYFK